MSTSRAPRNKDWINKGLEVYPPHTLLNRFDLYASVQVEPGGVFNRLTVLFLFLFALVVPHSVAAAHISLGLGFLAWVFRDIRSGRFNFGRTSIDIPLAGFCLLTVLSSVLSVEPGTSIPKLKTLLLFGVIYIISTNLNRAGGQVLIGLLVVSSLVGVGFSLAEKAWGRGVVLTEVPETSRLAALGVRPGDVVWMIGRRRIFSIAGANEQIRGYRPGEKVNVEVLHLGDPLPVELTVTEEMLASENPLGVRGEGRSRRFRIAGFSRQFLTYAEQMQILALLSWGGMLTFLRYRKRGLPGALIFSLTAIFILFSLALILTASRAVIASFAGALLLTSIGLGISGGRTAILIGLLAAAGIIGIGAYTIINSREGAVINFRDDSSARRIAYMKAGLRVIPKRPLLGAGMDSHKLHWKEWGFPGEYITHTHSTPIQIAMDRGLLTLAVYCWMMVAMMASSWFCWNRARRIGDTYGEALGLGTLSALIGFSISSLANYNFGDAEVLMMLFSLVGLASVALRNYDLQRMKETPDNLQ